MAMENMVGNYLKRAPIYLKMIKLNKKFQLTIIIHSDTDQLYLKSCLCIPTNYFLRKSNELLYVLYTNSKQETFAKLVFFTKMLLIGKD